MQCELVQSPIYHDAHGLESCDLASLFIYNPKTPPANVKGKQESREKRFQSKTTHLVVFPVTPCVFDAFDVSLITVRSVLLLLTKFECTCETGIQSTMSDVEESDVASDNWLIISLHPFLWQ